MKTIFHRICNFLIWPFCAPLVRVGGDTLNMRYVKALVKRNVGVKRVYNLQVSNSHTYIANSFHVHNCDVHTNADFGLGKGIYPLKRLPDYPFHPRCKCRMVEVFVDEIPKGYKLTNDKVDKGVKKYVKELPKAKQREILGEAGAKRFDDSGEWKDSLRNFNGYRPAKANIKREEFTSAK